MSNKRKNRKRTVIDILGEEEYEEYRDVIDIELCDSQKNLLLEKVKIQSNKKSKLKKTKSRKKSKNDVLIENLKFTNKNDEIESENRLNESPDSNTNI